MKTCDNCTNKDWCLITKPDRYYELKIFGGSSMCSEYSGVEGDKEMCIKDKIENAREDDWLTKDLSEEELNKIKEEVNREKAIEVIKVYHDKLTNSASNQLDGDIKAFELAIKALEEESKTGWIPVSERLPNDRDWYLGIFKEHDTGWINTLPFICDYVGKETKATTKEYWILRGFTDRDEHIDYYFNLECVAWMPLPKPYKAEKGAEE